jgi:protein-tyrosine phosphatase
VLFICTGNFYRSRFAQAAFNEQATDGWTAFSRGFDTSKPRKTTVSPLVSEELARRHVSPDRVAGAPTQLTRQDLDDASVVVLLDGAEHMPMLKKRFPDFPLDKVRSWSVADVPKTAPAVAFTQIWQAAAALLGELTAPRR